MATIRDVENKLTELVANTVYPNGFSNPSITGTLVKISVGWPVSSQLDIDVAAGNSQVTIFPVGKSDKNVTRFQKIWHEQIINPATIVSTVNLNQVVLSGIVSVPQAVLITLNNVNYSYVVQSVDTLDDVATNLAALLPSATAVGSTITISGELLQLSSDVIVQGILAQEIKRQVKLFMVSVFSPNPNDRDTLSDAIDVTLGNVERINFSDTTQAIVVYKAAQEFDTWEKNIIYQRDLIYTVEYPTMVYATADTIGAFDINITQTQ